MDYYNPYFYSLPLNVPTPRVGLFSRIFGNSSITLGSILNGTQKALNFANQAIPLVKQVRPMIGNAKTMFKVMNEFKRVERSQPAIPKKNTTNVKTANKIDITTDTKENENNYSNESMPTFFI